MLLADAHKLQSRSRPCPKYEGYPVNDERLLGVSRNHAERWMCQITIHVSFTVGRKATVHLDVTFTPFPGGLCPSYSYVSNVQLRVRELMDPVLPRRVR